MRKVEKLKVALTAFCFDIFQFFISFFSLICLLLNVVQPFNFQFFNFFFLI